MDLVLFPLFFDGSVQYFLIKTFVVVVVVVVLSMGVATIAT